MRNNRKESLVSVLFHDKTIREKNVCYGQLTGVGCLLFGNAVSELNRILIWEFAKVAHRPCKFGRAQCLPLPSC
jgi:hypothetical protein